MTKTCALNKGNHHITPFSTKLSLEIVTKKALGLEFPKTPRTPHQRNLKHEMKNKNDKCRSFIPSKASQDIGESRCEVGIPFQSTSTPPSSPKMYLKA